MCKIQEHPTALGHVMTSMRVQRLLAVIILASVFAPLSADEPLPARAFLRIGDSKLRHGSRILCLAFSPGGEMLAAGSGDDPVRLWQPRTGALIRAINEPWVETITFTPSGETMLLAGLQKNVRLWNLKLNKEIGKLEGHKSPVKALAVAPDTSLIAAGCHDGAIWLWDWQTKRKIDELAGHAGEVTALLYTPDGSLLISAGSDWVIQFWNGETNKSQLKLDAGCAVQALAISADGKTLFSAGDDNLIRRWDVATGKSTGTFTGHAGTVVSLIVNGDTLVSGSLDGTIRFWDAATTKQGRSLPRRLGDCDALALTKAGDLLATAGQTNTIRILAADTGKEVVPTPPPHAGLTALALAPARQRLAGLSLDGHILTWDAQTGKLFHAWDSKQTGEIVLAADALGKTVATAAETVRLWDADTGAEIAQLPIQNGDAVVALAFSPDGNTLAVGKRGGHCGLWNVSDKRTLHSFKYLGTLHALAWSPCGRFLAAAGGSHIRVVDPQTGALHKSFAVKQGPAASFPQVACLAFGPDGRTLAAGCFDATIRVYDVNAKNPTLDMVNVCEGHLSLPGAIAVSPDGRTIVSGGFDRTVRLWEAFSGKQIAQFTGHIGPVTGVAFAADGRSLYSAGADATILRWDVPGLLNNGKLPNVSLASAELEIAWRSLTAEDTPRGHEAMWRCVASAREAIPHMTKKLYLLESERVKKMFRDLDSNHFGTRLAATNELANYGRWMEGRYDSAIAEPPSLEYKRRVEALKERLTAANTPSLAQERLRMHRFMLLCEQAATPAAIDALKKLADKGPEVHLQEEAKASLKRLMGK